MGEKHKPRVLFVDDEPLVLRGFQLHLRKDFDVVTAESGYEALDVMKTEEPFDVIVSDMRMPGMSGAEFLAQAVEAAPDTVRILLTGYSDTDSAIRAVNEGRIFRFLTKPCRPPDLAAAVADAVKERQKLTADRSLLRREATRVTNKIIQAEKMATIGSLAENAGRELANLAAIHRRMIDATIARASEGAYVSPEDLADLRWIEQSLERHADHLTQFSEEHEEAPHLVDVRDAAARTLEILQVTGNLKHVQLDFDFAPECPGVWAARGRIQHVLLNVLVNALEAVDAADHSAEIKISVRPEDEHVVCEIQDTAGGVHAEVRPFMFKPYFSTKKGHAGLGLAVGSQIVEEYGGTLTMTTDGQTTTIRMALPIEPVDPEAATERQERSDA